MSEHRPEKYQRACPLHFKYFQARTFAPGTDLARGTPALGQIWLGTLLPRDTPALGHS